MDYTIIYAHGFASAGSSFKGNLIRKSFPSFKVLTPDLDHDPRAAIRQLEELVQKEKHAVMAGSSLGGFYAGYFNVRYDIPVLLVNPLVDARDLAQFLGENRNCCTGERFVLTEEDVDFLEELQRKKMRGYPDAPACVLLARDDEVLDYHKAVSYFQGENQFVVECVSGGHRFENEELIVSGLTALLEDVRDVDFSSPFVEAICKASALTKLRLRYK